MKLISRLTELMSTGFKRFFVALVGSVLLFLCLSFGIFNTFDQSIIAGITAALILSMLLSVTCKIFGERFPLPEKYTLISQSISAASVIPFSFVFYDLFDDVYMTLGWAGICAAVVIAIIWLLFKDAKFSLVIPHIIKSAAFSLLISLIVFAGISLCIAAISYLLFEIDYKWYLCALSFSFATLFVWLFLSTLPEKEEITVPKAFKIIFLYAAFPLYLALLGVLYIYLIKIAVTASMPAGQLNWFASFASLFFIVFYYTVLQYANPLTKFWARFGGYFLLPIIAIQAVAVYIRFDAYGLTSPRWISMLLSFTALIFIILSLIKHGRYVNATIPIFIVIILASTVTPYNFIDVPIYEQTARLEEVLYRNNMLTDGKIVKNNSLSDDDTDVIRSCYSVLNRSDKSPEYLNGEFYDLFGFERYDYEKDDDNYFYFGTEYAELNVEGYKTFGFFNSADEKNEAFYELNGKQYVFNDYFISLTETDIKSNEYIYTADDGTSFYFTYIELYLKDDGQINNYYFSGYYLTK